MLSNAQGTSAANGHAGGPFDPCDVRDAVPPRIWRYLTPVQLRG